MFERPVSCDSAASAYAFVESAFVCRQVPIAKRCVANVECPSRSPLAARSAPGARKTVESNPLPICTPSPLGARAAPHASRRARGRQLSRLPGTKTSEKSWQNGSQSANEMADLREPTERARAFRGLQRERPSARVRAWPNESLPPRAQRRTSLSRRARGRQLSRLPGTKTSEKSWKNRSRSANEMADLREPTERARAFHGLQRERPSAPVRAWPNESLQPRAAGAARPLLAPGARKTAQPIARN